MNDFVRDLETGTKVEIEDFINRKGIVVLYFTSPQFAVSPRIEPILSRLIQKWKYRGVSIGICTIGVVSSGIKVREQEIQFYHLPLYFFYHSGKLKFQLQDLYKDEDFEEIFVEIFDNL
ncbi:MAG: hypothetical protein GPJ51_03085 [Candidatus Heimdallarchaeota archaeon]|nr:hypothetical protein [Candidatus Heimdallarchaeota archaeon]